MQTRPLSVHSLDSGPVALPVAEYLQEWKREKGGNTVEGERGGGPGARERGSEEESRKSEKGGEE